MARITVILQQNIPLKGQGHQGGAKSGGNLVGAVSGQLTLHTPVTAEGADNPCSGPTMCHLGNSLNYVNKLGLFDPPRRAYRGTTQDGQTGLPKYGGS
ncbi:hypothetical protein [Arthrobacter sp. W4I7]|uniref:hypothetical protein n=1 Tax=Arthrobacter sp. W4I7 TaxID=3042296 RepID=UPI0027805ED8|nr:hypothetical protein [Arthrobacter sp. W4I7]MDQ0689776.1 hypothetical protein [Arthrobacter sp. W4I7]